MLHLETGVHLHEIKLLILGVHDELNGARADVAHRLGRTHGSLPQLASQLGAQTRGWGLLDDLLVSPLNRAVALEEVDGVAVLVGKHLHLDVAGPRDVPLEEHPVVSKGVARLAACRVELRQEFVGGQRDPHAFPAPSHHSLEHEWEAGSLGGLPQRSIILGLVVVPRNARDVRVEHDALRLGLLAHGCNRLCRGPDEFNPRLLEKPRKLGVFRQKPVARMHRI
mmetsp:Transcript_7497/g.19307  ORF Transcript_7497/g.19307 Transcript_7497/m.19307 type:complete len:224 (-) Transcript_7497:432-1103(-)